MNILHVGCGRKQWTADRLLPYVGLRFDEPCLITHLDADARLEPDVVCEVGYDPIPLPDNSVDLILAWHVIEHVGPEPQPWFSMWEEFYRVLNVDGWVYGESPNYDGIWAWSDPTHVRAISDHSFTFFSQDAYRKAESAISPYRLQCDFVWLSLPGLPQGRTVIQDERDARNRMLRFALKAHKPLRPWWEDEHAIDD